MKKILSIVISLALLVGCMAVATVSASAERLARYTVLVLDVSGSMEDNGRLDSEKKAAIKFCETATKNSSNKVALLTFSSHVEYTGEFTNDLEELKKEINALEPLGGTNFCESLAAASSRETLYFAPTVFPRQATHSKHTSTHLRTTAHTSDTATQL